MNVKNLNTNFNLKVKGNLIKILISQNSAKLKMISVTIK